MTTQATVTELHPNTKALPHLFSARAWWPYYLNKVEATVTANGQINAGPDRSYVDIFNSGVLDYYDAIDVYNLGEKAKAQQFRRTIVKERESILEKALMELCKLKMLESRKQCRDRLKFTTHSTVEHEKFLKAVIGVYTPVDVAVLCHWMWQVKRNLFGREDAYQIMLVFFGKQEGGKTKAIEKLIGPLEELSFKANEKNVSDDREVQALSDNLIPYWDELSNLARVEINRLKNVITTRDFQYRPLYTNKMVKIPRRASFIGASNKSLLEILNDPSGMRRFWQFKTLDVLDWDAVNSTDYMAMWQAIDESLENGYVLPYRQQIRDIQNEFVTKEDIDLFLEFIDYQSDFTGEKTFYPIEELYSTYVEWAGGFGQIKTSHSWIARKLKSRGILSVKKDKKLGYELNPDCLINKLVLKVKV